jgi:hypothetical protein
MSEVVTLFPPAGWDIGEDTSDLLLSIQDAFQIRVPEDCPFPATVGQLCDIVVSGLKGTRTKTCLTSVTFYKVRRALVDVLKVRRDLLSPSTECKTLLSRGPHRLRQWKDLEWRTTLKSPVLEHPTGVMWGLFTVLIAAATRFSLIGWTDRTVFDSLILMAGNWLLAAVFWLAAMVATRPLVWGLPGGCDTVGDLVNNVLAKNYGALSDEAGGWNEKEVWKALRRLIADQISWTLRKSPETPSSLKV